MTGRLPGFVGLALSAIAVALAAAPSAAASVTVGDCTVTALGPDKPHVNDARRKVTVAKGSIRCATAQRVQIDLYLLGEDPVSDDSVDAARTTFQATAGKEHVHSGAGSAFWMYGSCNEDQPGKDELYSKVRARVAPAGSGNGTQGPWSAWSKWARSKTVTYDCS